MCLRTFEICLEIYDLDPAHFIFAPASAKQAALKKNESKIKCFN